MYERLKKIWRRSWLITLPVTLVFCYLSFVTIQRYFTFGMKYPGRKINLYHMGTNQWQHLVAKTRLAFVPYDERPSRLRKVSLFISDSQLKKLDSNLPHSGYEYVDGILNHNGRNQKIRMRYRGDTNYHWARFKKSIRIKTKKKQLYEGMRKFNLIAPKFMAGLVMPNFASYQFAEEMGLITAYSEMVTVNINGENKGVFILVEQLDEMVLRKHNRMPGDIYVGEIIAKDHFIGVPRQMFRYAGMWTKASINNHFPDTHDKPLRRLLEVLALDSSEKQADLLADLVDVEEMARMSIYLSLVHSFHFGEDHNWRLYYDPWKTKFFPVIWDAMGMLNHNLSRPPVLDVITTDFHRKLHDNADFLRAKQRILYRFFNENQDELFVDRLKELQQEVIKELRIDGQLWMNNADTIIRRERINKKLMTKHFKQIRAGYFSGKHNVYFGSPLADGSLPIAVEGRSYVENLVLDFGKPLKSIPRKLEIRYWQDGKEKRVDITHAMVVTGSRVRIDVPLLADFNLARAKVKHYPGNLLEQGYYELVGNEQWRFGELKSIKVKRIGLNEKMAVKQTKIKKRHFSSLFKIIPVQPDSLPVVFSGEIVLEGIRSIDRDLVIKKGTTIKMKSGASLLIYGKLKAEGTKEKPIRIIAADEGQDPWGTFTLKGAGANGSRVKYAIFDGGSGYKGDLFEYSSMFSVHDVKDVVIDSVVFQNSKVVDDMVHAVYSTLRISNSVFRRSLSDALDIDISEAVIENCEFVDSGNDAVDLMTSRATIINTRFARSGDKGISVGEDSRLRGRELEFQHNNIGVQSKDRSAAVIANSNFISNNKAIDAYKKNWRYNAGGQVFLYNSILKKNKELLTADKNSKIFVHDSYLDGKVELKSKKKQRITLHLSNSRSLRKTETKRQWRFPEDEKIFKDEKNEFWQQIDSSKRGRTVNKAFTN